VKVLLVFGGPSAERNISAGSIKPWVTYLAQDERVELDVVFLARDTTPYRLPPLYWYANTCEDFEAELTDRLGWDGFDALARRHDVVIPLVHGELGEDGQLQRRLDGLGVRYLFSGPDGLAATLDKRAAHDRLAAAGLRVPAAEVVTAGEWRDDGDAAFARVAKLGERGLAVKPLRGGSSIGVSVVPTERQAFGAAMERALRFDGAALVEEVLVGREFSVVVLGGPVALAPTEPETHGAIFGMAEKYLEGTAPLHTPMRVSAGVIDRIRSEAGRAFTAFGLRQMARVDGFVDGDDVWITDVNGISGTGFASFVFLQTAMAGLDHGALIGRLLDLERAGHHAGRAERLRVHVIMGGPTSERHVSRQSGFFVGLCLTAMGHDVHYFLMDLLGRYTEIGLFYALHHQVEQVQALIDDVTRREAITELAGAIGDELGLDASVRDAHLHVGPTTDLAGAVAGADFAFLALHGGPGEDGTLQAALDTLGVPYNGSGVRASRLCADKVAAVDAVRAAGLAGVALPHQRPVHRDELWAWLQAGDEHDWTTPTVVCKPAADGCSSGVKLVRDGEELRQYAEAIVTCARTYPPEGPTDPDRPAMVMPETPPERWVIEQALVDPEPVPLPDGDLNAGTLRPWFERKRFVEITGAVIDVEGVLRAAEPSVTIAAGDELTLAEKFQQGVGANLPLSGFVPSGVVDSVRSRIAAIATTLGIEGYARLDCFYDRVDDLVYFLEANTLCGLTEATVFYSQALRSFNLSPPQVLDHVLRVGQETRGTRGRIADTTS
jgi:D-alanine--D-alanine ligase